jgi:transcription factor SPN1
LSKSGSSVNKTRVDDIHNSSDDEYDSGEDVVKTKEDDHFLDNEDDNEELLREYERDNDNFDDERPELGGGSMGRSSSSGPMKRVNGGGGIGMINPNTSNPFEQTLLTLKKSKAVEITDAKKGEIASDILNSMNQAAEEDRELYQQGQPAVRKLQMLSKMERAVTTKQLQMTLLDYDLLSVLKSWIEPMSKTVLAGLTIRNAVYDILKKLPCQTEQLKRSQIGKTLMTLVKHKQETNENKRKIREIVDKWSRPIFGKSIDARNIDIRERLMHETAAEREHRAEMIGKNTSGAVREKSSKQFELKTGEKEIVDDGRGRARMPMNHGLMFTVQPQSNVPGKGDTALLPGGKAAASTARKSQEDSSRNKIVRRLKVMQQSSGKKNFRLIQADVGGRDKA